MLTSLKLREALEKHNIDIVVDVSGADLESRNLLSIVHSVGERRLSRGARTPKLGYIYTSGTWVHGSSNAPVNDLTPVATLDAPTPPARITAWRPKFEQEVLATSDVLDSMVIRPALVYGRSSVLWTSLFEPIRTAAAAEAASVSVAAILDSRPGIVHVDDVGAGLHAAVDWLPLIAGRGLYPVFDLVTSQESMRDILEAAARELGFNGTVELAGVGDDVFMEAMSTSFNGNSGRSKQILGWEPKKIGFVQGMDIYAKAWAAGLDG